MGENQGRGLKNFDNLWIFMIIVFMHTFLQEQMVLRHHNEAESLNAVQKMDWEWKLQEINSGIKVKPAIDDLHVPMVQVNEDFDQLVS